MMRKFCVCCTMALCMILSGCVKSQPDVPEEITDEETAEFSDTLKLPEEDPYIYAGLPEPDSDPYIGTWGDPNAPQYRMEITGGDGYTVEIRRDCGGQETDVWQLTGTYDELWQGLACTGTKYTENADGQRTPVPDRDEISGMIYFEDDGILCWIDDFDHAGADLAFEKGGGMVEEP